MYICMCCVYDWVYTCVCVCTSVNEYIYIMCVWMRVAAITDLFVRSKLDNRRPRPDSDLCPLLTQYTGDSKTDPRDDPEIHTDSYSENQMAIRIQNCVISCEYLLFSYFPIYHYHWIFVFYSYHFM